MDELEFRQKIAESRKIIEDPEAEFMDHKGQRFFTIEKVEPKLERPCDWCGKMKIDHTIQTGIYKTPHKHWREKCMECGLWRHPNGCEMIAKGENIHHTWVKYLKELNINSGDD
jgi:hypothetical protein